MKQEVTKITAVDLNDASLKLKLYLNKLVNEVSSHATQERICHLAAENFLKFAESEQFTKENYQRLKVLTYDKKSYYLLYIIDILLKNNRLFMSLVKKDLQSMFKAVWQKVNSEPKKQTKLVYMKLMIKTWGVIYPKKMGIEESLKKWLQQKYETNLNLPQRFQALFEESYEKQKNQSESKLSMLISELSKEEPSKKSANSLFDLKNKIFQD